MSTESLAQALEHEHRRIDAGIEAFTRTGDTRPLAGALQALRRHIYLEEEFLFPPLRTAGLVAPVLVMLREHGQIWSVLDAIDRELAGNPGGSAVRDLCHDLVVLEQHHNPKEERILYPQADTALTASATAQLRAFLDSGALPAGWICEHARLASR